MALSGLGVAEGSLVVTPALRSFEDFGSALLGAAVAPGFAVNEYTFELRGGFVQAGFQRFIGTGAVLGSPEVQFVGSFSTAGTSLSFDVDRCDSADFDLPNSIPYSANVNSLSTIERAADGSTILITYTRS